MFDRFTARRPNARKAPVSPLQEPEGPAKRAEAATLPMEDGNPPAEPQADKAAKQPKELGGPSGPEPTRYGDWERKGICVDF